MTTLLLLLSLPSQAGDPRTEVGPTEPSWVQARLERAREHMANSEGGKLVAKAIEAHGGLERWYAAGTMHFVFDYAPIGKPEQRRHTLNKADLWSARVWQQEVDGDATFAWDGSEAWMAPGPDAFPSTARFWATTPYYFVAMPFVVADTGTRYEVLSDTELDGEPHHLVKVTYEDDVGDSPDDYYILYLHPETGKLGGLRYIVAYPGYFQPGEHSPEKLMVYSDFREVEGLLMAHRFDTYRWDAEAKKRGDKVTEVTARDYGFGDTWPAELFSRPDDAVVSELESKRAR